MKKTLALAALLFVAKGIVVDPVFATSLKPISCHTAENVADAGYGVTVSPGLQTAEITEMTIAGPRKVADLKCERPDPALQPRHPDALVNYLNCFAPRGMEQSLVVRFYAGGIGGFHYASVRNRSFIANRVLEQEVQFGRLNCR